MPKQRRRIMQSTERAVERLTQEHTEFEDGKAIEWPPLLTWLEHAVTEVVGRTGGGSGGAGVPLNTEALALLTYIDGRIKLMREAMNLTPTGVRGDDVKRLWRAVRDERAGGRMDDNQWDAISEEFVHWVHRIEAEDDRPRKLELTVPCPRCEQRWIIDDDQRVSAIRIEFKPGSAPVAECRNPECLAIWAGWSDIAKLGYTVGAQQNIAVLEACGIPVPTLAELFE